MEKRWIAVTAALAAGILTAGVALLPGVYSAVFDAEGMIEEQEPLPDGLYAAPGFFMDRFRYPMGEEAEALPEEEKKLRMDDSRDILGEEVYKRAFRLAGLEEEESCWTGLSVLKDGSSYLLRTPAEKEGKEYLFRLGMDERLLPYLVCCKRAQEPSAEEIREAVETLETLCKRELFSLQPYIEEIDGIYEEYQEYRSLVRELFITLLPEEEKVREISEKVPLWDCCIRGQWQVCADEKEAVLVCVMGRGSLVLYYDAVEKKLGGYRILFGKE